MTYPNTLRTRVMSYILDGGSKASASKIFKISRHTLYRWLGNVKERTGVKKRQAYKLDRERLISLVEAQPDLMLKEYAQELSVGVGCIHYALKSLGYSRKKNGSLQREKELCKLD